MSAFHKFIFVYSAFAPLYLLLALSLFMQNTLLWSIPALLLIISAFSFVFLIKVFKSKAKHNFHVSVGQSLDENTVPYLISFLPPVVSLNYEKIDILVLHAAYYMLVFVLIYFNRTMYLNIYFIIFGYRIYAATLVQSDRQIVLISKRKNRPATGVMALQEVVSSETYYLDR